MQKSNNTLEADFDPTKFDPITFEAYLEDLGPFEEKYFGIENRALFENFLDNTTNINPQNFYEIMQILLKV